MAFIHSCTGTTTANAPRHKGVCPPRTSQVHATVTTENHFLRLPLFFAVAATAVYVLHNPSFATNETIIGSPSRVIDGDTLIINRHRIRLQAIDAPELNQICLTENGVEQRCGQLARSLVQTYIRQANSIVECEGVNYDRFGRLVAVCKVDGLDIGAKLVSDGYAVAYRQYGQQYVSLENQARQQRRGIWATQFQNPADYRREVNKQRKRN